MAAPTCILTSIKKFNYRGNPNEEWANRYMFTGPTPNGPTVWRALWDQLWTVERAILPGVIISVRAYGHISTDPDANAVWSDTRGLTGNTGLLDATGGTGLPGDTAVYLSLKTDRRNSKGKLVYLRKYFHGAVRQTSDQDAVLSTQKTALNALGSVLVAGITADNRRLCDPLGNVAVDFKAGDYVTTRTLKRRGRRP